MDFELSHQERQHFIREIVFFVELITAFEDSGVYSENPTITRATHQTKSGLKDLRSSIEAESVMDGPEPEKSLIMDTIRKGRAHHEH